MTASHWLLPLTLGLACSAHRPPTTTTEPLRVWIDTDPALGMPNRDVDDGLALLQALRSPELDVVGVSTVFGNVPLADGDPIARELVAAWAPDVPVFTGAAGPGLDPTPATDALLRALQDGPLVVLALGPATNVATVIVEQPELADQLREVIAVAGRRPGERFTTGTTNPAGHPDLNFENDPEAFEVLLEARVPLTLAPFALSSQVSVTAPTIDAWATGPHGDRLGDASRAWLGLWQDTFAVEGFHPFDTLAVGLALPIQRAIGCTPGLAALETGPSDATLEAMQGTDTPTKPYLHVRPLGEAGADDAVQGAPVAWCDTVDAPAFLADLTARVTRP